MNRENQIRFVAVLLFLLTVAAVVFAGFNFQKERGFAVPDLQVARERRHRYDSFPSIGAPDGDPGATTLLHSVPRFTSGRRAESEC